MEKITIDNFKRIISDKYSKIKVFINSKDNLLKYYAKAKYTDEYYTLLSDNDELVIIYNDVGDIEYECLGLGMQILKFTYQSMNIGLLLY